MGFVPQLTIDARYSWTVLLHCHHHDLATTLVWAASPRFGSNRCWPLRSGRSASTPLMHAAKLSGRVNKTFDWHKPPLIERIYIDIELLQFRRLVLSKHLSSSEAFNSVTRRTKCATAAVTALPCLLSRDRGLKKIKSGSKKN